MKWIGVLAGALLCAAPLAAQDGAGSAGAVVLQLPAGSRAPALSGAYAGVSNDADALFYNPAGIAGLDGAATVSYQRHVEDIGFASAGGAFRVGRVVVGASLLMLDYGDIAEIVPDDDFGGQTGRPTGNTIGSSELAARVSAAMPLAGRFHVGLAAGYVSTDLAGASRGAPFLDAGVQYAALPRVTFGAALRNFGGSMTGNGLADAPLPKELRAGAAVDLTAAGGLGARLVADVVTALEEGTTGVVAGVEAGLAPATAGGLGAVGRLGFDAGTGDDGLGAVRFGGGISLSGIAVDYTYQNYEYFGAIHRFGIRWSRLP